MGLVDMPPTFGDHTILVIAPNYPYPPHTGALIDIWGHAAFFHEQGWRVVLCICRTESIAARAAEADLPALPLPIETVFVTRPQRWPVREADATVVTVQKAVDAYRPGVIWIEYADFDDLAHRLDTHGAPIWFRSVNFELMHRWEKAVNNLPPADSWRARLRRLPGWWRQQRPLLVAAWRAERRMHRRADAVFYIAHAERRLMPWLYWGRQPRYWTLPLLDVASLARDETPHDAPLNVVYMGGQYSLSVNRAGALTLLDEVIPAVRLELPGAYRFNFVGRGSADYLGAHAANDVVLHGYVESLPEFLAGMDVAAVPVRLGWGCKLKMLEALAYGLPVVGARQAFRCIPSTPDAYYTCRRTSDYVAALRALRDPATRAAVGAAGRAVFDRWTAASRAQLAGALADLDHQPE